MSKKVFKLSDLSNRGCDVEFSSSEGNFTLTLKKFTLMDQIWCEEEFGSVKEWESTLFPKDENYSEAAWLKALLKTFHRLMEEKKEYPSWEDLGEKLELSVEVLTGMQKALLYVLNGSQPLIDKFDEEVKKNLKTQSKKTKKKARTGTK